MLDIRAGLNGFFKQALKTMPKIIAKLKKNKSSKTVKHRSPSINKSLKKIIFKKPIAGLEKYFQKNQPQQTKSLHLVSPSHKLIAKKITAKKLVSQKALKFYLGLPLLSDLPRSKKTGRLIHKSKSKKRKTAPRFRPYPHKFVTFWKSHPRVLVSFLIVSTTFTGLTYYFVFKDLPNPRELVSSKPPMTTIIRDRHGRVLYRVYNNANRVQLSFGDIPDVVKKSTIAIEDSNFYHHIGIDFKGILRAFLNNLKEEDMDFYQGGSTITQQLIKNRFFTPEKSYQRKVREIVLSIWAEMIYSKEEILKEYLNTVGYGGPAYGIEAAAQMYFSKSTTDLDLAEAAFLAGLPAAPTTFSPYGTKPQLANLRKQQVLERMYKLKMINEDEYFKAINEKITLAPPKINILAPHFVMYVKDELVDKFGEKAVEEGGLDVTTTLDLDIHNKAQEIVRNNIESIGNRFRINNAATLVTDPKTGEILAMVGSVDYFDAKNDGHYNATFAPRQPGSSIKPVMYSFAFDHGFSPTSTVLDAPIVYKSPGSKEIYAPVNYDGKFHGNVTLRSALANSYNIPAVKTLEKIGVDNMINQGLSMGIKSWQKIPSIGLSLTLGGAEVTMLDMARAYGTIANMGIKKELRSIISIKDSTNQDLTDAFYKSQDLALVPKVAAGTDENTLGTEDDNISDNDQVISPLSAYWLTDILSDNVARLPAFGSNAKLTVPDHKVAVKTGTSNNFRDNWTIGYTPSYLVAAWVGNNDGSFMNRNLVSGITGAAPIWNEVMTYLLEDEEPEDFAAPGGLIAVNVCAVNGLLTCPNCPQEKTEYFTADKVPTQKCFFRPAGECAEAKKQSEGKSDDEKKQLLSGCPNTN
ncbi:hypothetical protein A2W14_02175 [Candidatus Gottesmanbacteria bacterium RBG_16_37_8]|uniref:Uncharacterized protein n=1 Tax=Candidatus Gottesmanbacteria bacterium RBG_16_37_8 TaxID=1798371 RepID=A0A1F5YSL7_9BACT|nr:MAG: hypothetical protein A2W14_02175 [Candidatus Gottesmanbacteria bacterium RBG_16_37_8]